MPHYRLFTAIEVDLQRIILFLLNEYVYSPLGFRCFLPAISLHNYKLMRRFLFERLDVPYFYVWIWRTEKKRLQFCKFLAKKVPLYKFGMLLSISKRLGGKDKKFLITSFTGPNSNAETNQLNNKDSNKLSFEDE